MPLVYNKGGVIAGGEAAADSEITPPQPPQQLGWLCL